MSFRLVPPAIVNFQSAPNRGTNITPNCSPCAGCARTGMTGASGDSGGPVFADVGGRATVIGVVSGTEAGRAGEECYEGMEDPHLMSYSNVKQVMAVIRHAVPDAEFIPRRW